MDTAGPRHLSSASFGHTMRLSHLLRGIALALPLSACIVFVGPDDPAPVRDLVAARARWNVNGPASYAVVARANCFCILGGQDVRVVVQRGTIVSATVLSTGAAVPSHSIANYRTVEQLFDLIDDAARKKAYLIEASYDARFGHPTRFWIDYSPQMADEEFGYEIVSLTPG
jgi:Family of unknown function (DUF6174)